MPLYEYSDPETGVRIELQRKVEDRNKDIVLKRTKSVPERVTIHGLGPTPSQEFNADILNGWYAEQQYGTRLQTGEFTKEEIKKAWTNE
jgi:hypothetical protein